MKIRNSFVFIIVGSSLEYYDFVLYGLLASHISKNFFPISDNTTAFLQTFLVFALGYLIRPISGTLLGLIADKYSQIRVFSFSILLMGIATLGIGLVPSYDKIGILSPILLTCARLAQGISFASELPGAVTLFNHSYFRTHISVSKSIGCLMSSTGLGFILASVVVYILNISLTHEEILQGGWRIPFIIGGILAFFSYFIRRNLESTDELQPFHTEVKLISFFMFAKNFFTNEFLLLLKGVVITSVMASGTILFIYLPHCLEEYMHLSHALISLGLFLGLIVFSLFSALFGYFTEGLDVKKLFVLFSSIFPAFLYSAIIFIEKFPSQLSLFILFMGYEVFMAMFFVSGLKILSALFSDVHKNTAISFCYNISFAIFAFLPAIFTYLISITHKMTSICLLIAMVCAFSLVGIYFEPLKILKNNEQS